MTRPGRPRIRLPEGFATRAEDVLVRGAEPAPPRDAATVMLLRPGNPSGISVYLLRRASTMAFAPRAIVFPGGSVDPRDADETVAWAGPDCARWGEMLGADAGLARALVCAAVRETFEESGVLLAGPTPDTVVASTATAQWETDRQALLHRQVSLAGLLRFRGLVLRSDLLRPWARWVTPVAEPRRYDTRFFAAAMPPGQVTRDVGGEADRADWLEPGQVLAAARRGDVLLLPPTAVSLAELLAHGTVEKALTARRRISPLMPEVILEQDAVWLALPDGVEYPL
jgi:8-oxo-dGTP pyrophosphatase MutT (NUDIX family)